MVDLTTQTQDFTGQQPFHQINRVRRLVARDGNVDELQRRIGVAEGNDRNVDVGSFVEGLVICQQSVICTMVTISRCGSRKADWI